MHLKYLHYYGNESNESILEAYGIVTKDHQQKDALRPKQCPNCNEPNKPDGKFCAKCRMVLTYDAYSMTIDSQKEKDDEIEAVKQQMKLLKEAIYDMQQLMRNPTKLIEISEMVNQKSL